MNSSTASPAPSASTSVARRAVALARGAGSNLANRLVNLRKLTFLTVGGGARSSALGSRSGSAVSPKPIHGNNAGGERPGMPGGRRVGIVWFRSDLRLDDNEALNKANSQCTSVLPVYCFDPRDYTRSPQGYDRTGPYRATFLLQAVTDLRNRLQSAGSDLIVRIGHPEEVLSELSRRVGASAVYCHSEVTYEEKQAERRVQEAIKSTGAQFNSFWTNTLHSIEDLPFPLADMPQNFDKFRSSMAKAAPRPAVSVPDQLKSLPVASIDNGEIPSLQDLGLKPFADYSESTSSKNADDGSNNSNSNNNNNLHGCIGGETEGLRQLKHFLKNATTSSSSSSSSIGMAHASSFSSSIAPWLATGCLSPRRMLAEAEKVLFNGTQCTSGESNKGGAGSLQWVRYELLWRDFFRLLTKRHSEVLLPKAKEAVLAASSAESLNPMLAVA